jgi:hypothetical protein
MGEQRLVDTKGLSKYLGIPAASLSKARSIGYPKIPYIKIGKTVRYNLDQVDAFLVENTVNGEKP